MILVLSFEIGEFECEKHTMSKADFKKELNIQNMTVTIIESDW